MNCYNACQTIVFKAMKIKGDTLLLDGNHPLAGEALRFAIKVISVRQASEEKSLTSRCMASMGIIIDG